jgi:hypothetical protein
MEFRRTVNNGNNVNSVGSVSGSRGVNGSLGGSSLLSFADAADGVCRVAHQLALAVPSFRSPPSRTDVDRSIRWSAEGCATVAVRVRDRPVSAVERDLVEGVLQANRLSGATRDETRQRMILLLHGNAPQAIEPAA